MAFQLTKASAGLSDPHYHLVRQGGTQCTALQEEKPRAHLGGNLCLLACSPALCIPPSAQPPSALHLRLAWEPDRWPAHPASQVGMTHPPSRDSLLRCLLGPTSRGLGGHSPTSCTSPQPAGRVPTSPPQGTHPATALPGGLSTANKKPRQGESRHQGAQPASPLPSGPPSSLPHPCPHLPFPW